LALIITLSDIWSTLFPLFFVRLEIRRSLLSPDERKSFRLRRGGLEWGAERKTAMRSLFILSAAILLLAGCATAPRISPPAEPGRVDTFSASVSVSVKGVEGGGSARGYLLYRRPDRFRMTVVSPFGTPVLEAFITGERVTVVVPGEQTAYAGTTAELPKQGPLAALGDVSAAADIDWRPEAGAGEVPAVGGEIRRYDGKGLLVGKLLPGGEEISYGDYADAGGIPFPASVTVTRPHGMTVSINLDEPQVNVPLEETVFGPNVAGMRLLPLSVLTPPPPRGP
jgi:hypothetical protein